MEILVYQDSDATNKINLFRSKCSSKTGFFQIEFMMEEFEVVVAQDYKFEKGGEIRKRHFFEFSDCEDTDARNTNREFAHRKPFY